MMSRRTKNERGQAILGEYGIVILLVVASIVAMTIYFKRAVQARIHDARDYMVTEARSRAGGDYDGPLYLHYEPYYTNTASTVLRSSDETTGLLPGESSGVYRKTFSETSEIQTFSETAPPKDFDLTTPGN